jgi:hypothetical protein
MSDYSDDEIDSVPWDESRWKVDMNDIVTITARLHSCSECGALTLPDDRSTHARWHEKMDEARWRIMALESDDA